MKRPAKSNYETVVVECSDFNQIAFNPPDPSKSVLIKTEQQRANKKQGKKITSNGHCKKVWNTPTLQK